VHQEFTALWIVGFV